MTYELSVNISKSILEPVAPMPQPSAAEAALVQTLEGGRAALPLLPDVATRALELANNRDASVREFSELIMKDPPIAARFIATANSALYSRGQTIRSVGDAVARIGLGASRDLVFQVVYANTVTGLKQFQEEVARVAAAIEASGMAEVSKTYGAGPTRVQYQNKDPRGYAEFLTQLAEHSTLGAANTQRGVQGRRPSLWELTEQMKKLEVPTLIATGDEDDPCLDPGILMKRLIPSAALVVFPNTGHALNIEEPDLFNRSLADFFHQVESGRWPRRDPRSVTGSILGM